MCLVFYSSLKFLVIYQMKRLRSENRDIYLLVFYSLYPVILFYYKISVYLRNAR